jgi:hypothetical protein
MLSLARPPEVAHSYNQKSSIHTTRSHPPIHATRVRPSIPPEVAHPYHHRSLIYTTTDVAQTQNKRYPKHTARSRLSIPPMVIPPIQTTRGHLSTHEGKFNLLWSSNIVRSSMDVPVIQHWIKISLNNEQLRSTIRTAARLRLRTPA